MRRIASCLLAAALVAGPAAAHVGHPLLKADRVLTIVLTEPVTLEYVVRIAPSELARIRKSADGDGNGQVSQVEAQALLATFTAALGRDVRVAEGAFEAKPLSAHRQIAFEATGLEGPVADLPGPGARIAWTHAIAIGDGDRIRIDDGLAIVPFDHTEVVIKDTAARPLLGLGDDPKSLAITPKLGWVDAGKTGTRSIHVVWRASEKSTLPWVPIAFAVGVIATLAWASRKRG